MNILNNLLEPSS